MYAPLGLDIRAKWSVGGSLPGEPKQPIELGLDAPREGLYIREDVKMKCNIMMISFVKKTFKESHSKLVDRLVDKAHAVEAQLANERLEALKTLDPRERMGHGEIPIAPPPGHGSPANHPAHMSMHSSASGQSYGSRSSQSQYPSTPPTSYHSRQDSRQLHQGQPGGHPGQYQAYQAAPVELPSGDLPNQSKGKQSYSAELPG